MSLVRSTVVVTAATAVSRLLGFARDILLAQALGAGPVADAFLAVFRVPNLVRRVLGEGGLNAGFVPIYARLKAEKGPEAAAGFAAQALSTIAVALLALVAVVELAAGAVVLVFAAGTVDEPAAHALATGYLRLSFPFVLGAGLASLVSALLNAERRVAAASLAPMVVNLTLVAALLLVRGRPDLAPERQAAWLAAATGISGLLHLVIVALAARRLPGALRIAAPRLSPELMRLLAAGAPALAASGAAQLILLAGTQVASFTPSALSWLYYADRLFQLPLGFVGAAVGLVLLPEMASRHAGAGTLAVLEAQNRALEAGLLLGLPAAIALALLSRPIVTVLFERGAFGPEDAIGTAAALAGLAAGLPFAVAGKVLSQTFFARHDVRTPIFASLLGIVAALGGAAVLARGFGASGIGLGIAAGFAAHAAALVWRLRHAGLWRPDSRLKLRVGGGLVASAAMALAIAGVGLWVDVAVGPNRGHALDAAILLGLCLGGLAFYVAIAWALGAIRRDEPGLSVEKA